MNKILMTILVMGGAATVAIADVLIKKIFAPRTGFWIDAKNPLTIIVVLLYLVQIGIFAYLFDKKAALGIVGAVQIALYALIVIGSGVLFFQEHLTAMQSVGIALAVIGVVLMNL
jgi:multidrug transporter EmrE-like cation transporter